MNKILFLVILFSPIITFGQKTTSSDSLFKETQRRMGIAKQMRDSSLHPINYAKTLEEHLLSNFPQNSSKDGRWVFYKDRANVEKQNKPNLKAIIPNSDFYRVTMTNYLGYHVNQGTCLIVFDSINSKITLAQPIWYGGISEPFVKLFIGHKFNSKDSLLSFLTEFNELMQIGSSYKFRQTLITDSLITLDLGYFKGDSYTTRGNGTSSTVNYNEDGVWRKIIINIKDLAIIRYTSINPKMNDKEIIK